MKKDTKQLPTRFHIGTQKAGSTYLYNLLADHPQITLADDHEVNFFSSRYDKGLKWYKQVFPNGEYKIDISPNALKHSPQTPNRIYSTYDSTNNLRFTLFLRNPIDYVASHFHMHKKLQRWRDDPDHYPRPDETIDDYVREYPEYFDRGKYTKLLDHWLEHFSRDQIKIFIFEEFIDDSQAVTTQMLTFWNIPEPDKGLTVNQVSQNKALKYSWLYCLRGYIAEHEWLKSRLKRSHLLNWIVNNFFAASPASELARSQREELAKVFADDVQRLESEYGVDISRWEDFV